MSILIENVSKEFNGKTVLDSINLEIKTGSLVALLGGSGSGKSTLLRVVAGFEQPDSGRIWLYGKDSRNLSVQEKEIGFVFQAYALFQHLTVYENIAFGLTLNKKRFLLYPKDSDSFGTRQPIITSKFSSPIKNSSNPWSFWSGLGGEEESFPIVYKHQLISHRANATKPQHELHSSQPASPLAGRPSARIPFLRTTALVGNRRPTVESDNYAKGLERNKQREFVGLTCGRRSPLDFSTKGFFTEWPTTTFRSPRISSNLKIGGKFRGNYHKDNTSPTVRCKRGTNACPNNSLSYVTGPCKPINHHPKDGRVILGLASTYGWLAGLGKNLLNLKSRFRYNFANQGFASVKAPMLPQLSSGLGIERVFLNGIPSHYRHSATDPLDLRQNPPSHFPFAVEKPTESLSVNSKAKFMRSGAYDVRTTGRAPLTKTGQSVEELLKVVELDELAHRYPAQLSGGQCQRVALARALAVEPKVLLLDEPFGALDQKVRKQLRRWLRQLHEKVGVTTIFVTHDYQEAMEVANEIVVLDQGRVKHSLQHPKNFFKKMTQTP